LKHPLSACGKSPVLFRKEIQTLEKICRKDNLPFEPELPEKLHDFFALFTNPVPIPFEELIKAHIEATEALATSDDRTAEERLWSKEDGIILSDLLTTLSERASHFPVMDVVEYPAFLKVLMRTKSIRPKYGMHPRLDVLGVMESRLQSPDLVIIGGLNEGSFPEKACDDLWLSRPMRKQLGLPLPEEKIGIAANDFTHAFMAKEVILSRALKEGTTPTIPSRWLLRMETLLKSSAQEISPQKHPLLKAVRPFLKTVPCERPMPCPPLFARPDKMSVTGIEKWMQDPYGIYASKILNLQKLPDLGEKNNASYGTAVHSVLSDFMNLPPHLRTREKINELAQIAFEEHKLTPQQLAFIRPKFDKAMDWIMDNLPDGQPFTEKNAVMELPLQTGSFTLYGRADRIDITQDGAVIIDYKTGSHPNKSQIQKGFAPQLPLEALLLENGAFKEIGSFKTADMSYISLSGKGKGAEATSAVDKKMSAETLIKKTYDNLVCLINLFRQESTPYTACPIKSIQPKYNDYAHLERLAEWQSSQDGDNTDE
ncbi:MAG: PD-(D/E)XK nuclease family protein, partial [Alphaproteobacteria bacterium]|nr:PD-(D/E)XK nuclease family protein [Alphaproteobacteria bacterium]